MTTLEADAATVSDRIYSRIRSDVILGRLAPGQRLTLDRMRDAYGTSIGTLREVLNRLSSEGFVAAEGARGFEVAPASVDNLREVASVRQLLECHALRASFEAGDIEWEGRPMLAIQLPGADENAAWLIARPTLWDQFPATVRRYAPPTAPAQLDVGEEGDAG